MYQCLAILSRTTSAKSSNGASSNTGTFREGVDFDGLVSGLRRVCSVGKTEKEGVVVKGKSEDEGEENRALYEASCYNAGPNWRNEYVANLSLTTQVNVNNGNKRLIRRM